MSYFAYHRTSTKEQHLDRGITEIKEYCKHNDISLEKIYTDQQTGKTFTRPGYSLMKNEVLRSGDTLIISELDRLGRNKKGILQELRYFMEKNVRVMILELPTTLTDYGKMDNTLAMLMMETINNMLIEMYASLAQAEMEKKEKRQREGIEEMKKRGEWDLYGRPKAMDFSVFCKEYQRLEKGSITPTELMRELNLTKPTYYRYRKQYMENSSN